MIKIDWSYTFISVLAGVTLGLSVGIASHWGLGLAMFIGWLGIQAGTNGFHAIADVPSAITARAN
jgi:hypothetical protein